MLEARGSAVSPGAAREVLAGARAAIAGPSGREGAGVAFDPRPVAAIRRRSRTPWGIAALAVAAVVAIAMLGSRVTIERPRASDAVVGSSPVTSGPSGGTVLGSLSAEELRTELAANRLDGKTVVISGRAMVAPGRCRIGPSTDPANDCTFVKIDGLPELFIGKGGRTAEEVETAIEQFGMSRAPLVLRGSGQGLDLVGWLVNAVDGPMVPEGLDQTLVPDGGVVSVIGWLHRGTDVSTAYDNQRVGTRRLRPCRRLPAARCQRSRVGKVARRPDSRPNRLPHRVGRGWTDRLVEHALGRPAADGPRGPDDPCHGPHERALDDRSLDGQVLAIDGELKDVAWECPLQAPEPCHRFYMDGLPGVAITWDGGFVAEPGVVQVLIPGSSAAPEASDAVMSGALVSVMSGRMLVTPRDGYLELLGRVPARSTRCMTSTS